MGCTSSWTIHPTIKSLVDDYIAVGLNSKAGRGVHPTIYSLVYFPSPFSPPDILSLLVLFKREMVISIDQVSYILLPMISGIKEHNKYTSSCASWNCLNPFPKINRFVAWSSKRTPVAALALVMHPYYIMGGVLHPGNNPKQLQTIQSFHKCWRPPPSCQSRRWVFATASSEVMSFCCRKAQTDPQVRVRQLLMTQTTLTNPIVLVRRLPRPQRLHDHQLINEFVGCRCRTFTHVVERHLMIQ